MAAIDKPITLNQVWSEQGENVMPPDTKIREGWKVEIPPREWYNWLDNRQDQAIAHINQHGVAVWDSETEYQAGKSYAQDPSDGAVYVCLVTNTGMQPSTSAVQWKKAFADSDDPRILNAVPSSRQIISGIGLSGGGNLSANRTLSVNYGTTAGTAAQGNDSRIVNAVPNSRQVIAGTGLSGGGNLSTNRTLSIASSHTPIGVGQTWQNMTSSRARDTTYTNTTGRTIVVMLNTGNNNKDFFVNGVAFNLWSEAATATFIIPPGSTYSTSNNFTTFMELR